MNCLIKIHYHKQLAMIFFFKEIGEKGGLEEQTREEEQSIFHF